ncbi:hypothetical protein JL721_1893 [Aureococcus anophagefferens]|nr:hypothetical protein JL721_1893 [Aureococcus anophagefferens]
MAVLRYLVVAAALYAAAAPGGGDDVPAVADTPAEPRAADWLASLLFARRSLETIWAAGLRRHVSERARGVLLETMAYYDGSFEVLEASVDFGAGLPPLNRVETREPTPALVDALRPGAKTLAYAVEVGDWALETPGGFASLDLELRGRFAKYAVPRLGVTFESATIAASTLVVAVEVTDAYPFLGTAAFGFDGAAGRPRLDATSFVGAEAARADFEFAPFGSMVADEIHRSLPVAQRDVWTFDLGAWLVTCDGGGQSNATRREAPEPAPIPEEPVSRKTPPPTRVVDRVRELDALCDDGAPRRRPLRKLNAFVRCRLRAGVADDAPPAAPPADVSADREPTARELLAAARSVQRERDSILADAEAKRNAAEAFRTQLAASASMAELTSKERRLAKRAAAREAAGAKQPSDATTKPPAAAPSDGGLTAKERRKLKRAAERGEAAPAPTKTTSAFDAAAAGGTSKARGEARARREAGGAKSSKKRPREPSSAPLVAFVGQLGFSVTAERLKAFFTSQDVPGTLKVRLLTDAKTGKSRGMAFVQCETAEALYACVALHHAQIDGRRINVERSAGGGREAKKGKLAEHRAHQSKKVEETVDRVLEEFVASGQLRRDEVDDGVRRLLQRRSGRVAHAALTEYASLVGRDKFENPAAYLTKIICRVSQEENPFEKYSHEPREAEIVVPKPFRGDEPDEPAACPGDDADAPPTTAKERRAAKRAALQAPAPELLSLNRDDARADEAQLTAKERRARGGHGAQEAPPAEEAAAEAPAAEAPAAEAPADEAPAADEPQLTASGAR